MQCMQCGEALTDGVYAVWCVWCGAYRFHTNMAFVNLVEQDLALSLVHAAAVIRGWPLPKHDPALDVKLDDKEDDTPEDAPVSDKPKTKKRLEKERLAAEKLKAEREARRKDIEAKRAAEALVQAEIKKNAVYVKLMNLASDSKSYDDLLDAVLTNTIKAQAVSEAGMCDV